MAFTITPDLVAGIRGLIQAHHGEISQKNPLPGVVERYFAGKHRVVFQLTQYPDLLIKLSFADAQSDQGMRATIAKCRQVVQNLGLVRCVIPEVHWEPEPNFWIEQKLEGTYDPVVARDLSEREFEQFSQDPSLRDKWMEIFHQAALFIVETGYHDVDWRNLLLMKEGVGFVDFEKISSSASEKAHGLQRLLAIAPLEAIDRILQVVANGGLEQTLFRYQEQDQDFVEKGFVSGTPYADAVEILRAVRAERLALYAKLRRFHETKGVALDSNHTPLDLSLGEDDLQKRILQECNKRLEEKNHFSQSPLEVRKLSWQPFSSDISTNDRTRFEGALQRLKDREVIGDWRLHRARQVSCYQYIIYF